MRTWSFLPDERRLKSQDEVAVLTRRAASVLDLLLRRKGELVSTGDILKIVWAGVSVTPDLVREYVSDLRAALGDDARTPRYIETVRGKGFKLIGGVEFDGTRNPTPNFVRRARIGVLRPDCLEGGERWQRFADGMAEELTTDLARFGDLAVVARNSCFAIDKKRDLRAVAEDLGCDYLLESSVSAWPDRMRAHFQLIDGRTGHHVWADRFDRTAETIYDQSNAISLAVANQLGGIGGEVIRAERRYAGRRPPAELGAYENYVVACEKEHSFDFDSVQSAMVHIDRVVELDPDFARGWMIRYLLCDRAHNYFPERPKEHWQNEAYTSIDRAAGLDRRDPAILALLAFALGCRGLNDQAVDAATRAADLADNQADAAIMSGDAATLVSGDLAVAERLIGLGYSLNPFPPGWYGLSRCRFLLYSGQYAEAERVALASPVYEATLVVRCLSQALQGKSAEAAATRSVLQKTYPTFSFDTYPQTFGIISDVALRCYHEGVGLLGR